MRTLYRNDRAGEFPQSWYAASAEIPAAPRDPLDGDARVDVAIVGAGMTGMEHPPGITGGILLQVINPKAYAVNTALFTGFGFLPANYPVEIALKFLILNVIWIPIHFAWLWAGISLRRMNLPHRTQRTINIAMALSMLAVVALAALAQG